RRGRAADPAVAAAFVRRGALARYGRLRREAAPLPLRDLLRPTPLAPGVRLGRAVVRERSEERLAVEAKPGHGGRVLRNLAQLGLGVGAAVGIAWFLRSQTWVFHNSSGDWLVRAFSAVVALACFGAGLAAARR